MVDSARLQVIVKTTTNRDATKGMAHAAHFPIDALAITDAPKGCGLKACMMHTGACAPA